MAGTAAVLDIVIKAQTGKAALELKKFERNLKSAERVARDHDTAILRSDKSTRSFGSAITDANQRVLGFKNAVGVIKWPALIAGAGAATQALSALGAGAAGLTSSLAPLSGALVALPAAFGAAAQGAGVTALAFNGLSDALGAMSDAQAQGGAAAVDMAAKQRAAAEQHRAAAEQVRSAEQTLATAQRSVITAQEGLTAARFDAERQLQDMRRAAVDAALGERGAALSLERARNELRSARAHPGDTTNLEMRELLYDVRVAEDAVKDARRENARSQEDLTRAERAGISGSEQVVSARRELAEANRSVAEASRGVVMAQREVVRVQRDAAESMKETGGATDTLAEKMAALPPAAQAFAKFLFSLKPALDQLREGAAAGLFPGLTSGVKAAMNNLPALHQVVGATADAMGDLARRAGEFVGREGFGKDFEKVGKNNAQLLERMGRAGLNFGDAMRHIMVVAEPLIDFFGRGLMTFSRWAEESARAGRESGRLAEFFGRTEKVTRQLVSIGGSLATVFMDIGRAARPLGDEIMVKLVRGARDLAAWTSGNQGTLRQYFEDARDPLMEAGKLVGDIVKGFFSLSQTEGLDKLIHKFRKELLPAVLEMTKSTTKQFGPVLINFLIEATKLMTNFMGSTGPLTLFIKGLTTAARLLNELFDAIPALATAASSALAGFSIVKLLGLGGASAKGGVFSKLGASMGARFGMSFGGQAGPVIASAIAATLAGVEVGRKLNLGMNEVGKKIAEELDIGLKKAMEVEKFMRSHPGLSAPDAFQMMKDSAREARKEVIDDIELLSNRWGASLAEINQRTASNMRAISQSMNDGSSRAKLAVMKNFEAARDAIKASMEAGEISAKRGAQAIHQVLIKQLKSYGISDPEGFLNQHEARVTDRQPGSRQGMQKGGMVPGSGSGDKVPLSIGGRLAAMVEPGEYVSVANRNATAALMAANQAVPRFASGGQLDFALGPETVPPIQYDANHAGGNSHWHITGTSTPWVVGIGKALQKMGFMVGEHPAFGGVQAQHSATGGHYDALAIDVNSAADETHAETVRVAALLGGKGGGAASGFAGALKLALPRFSSTIGLGAMVAQGLNNSAAAVEKVIGKLASAKVGAARGVTGGVNSSYNGPLDRVFPEHTLSNAAGHVRLSPEQVTMIANKAGLPGSTFEKIAHGESQYYPGVVGSDAEAGFGNTFGHGLWQITSGPGGQGPPWGDLIQSLGGRRQMFNPITNSEAAKHIYEAQGIGAWYGTQFLQKGGVLKLAKGSGGGPHYTRGTTYTPPGVRGGSYAPPDIPKKIQDMLTAYSGAIGMLDNKILLAEHFAGYASSEAGADLGPMERATQLFLNEQLLTNLEGMRDWIKRGMGLKRTTKKGKGILAGLLGPLVGDAESVGRILETKKTIDDLRHPESSTTTDDNLAERVSLLAAMLQQANLRTAVSQAQYGAFAGMFAGGGYIPGGKWGIAGEAGPEVITGPAQVYPTGTGSVNVAVYLAPDGRSAEVVVNGESFKQRVQQATRGTGQRPLAGSRGY